MKTTFFILVQIFIICTSALHDVTNQPFCTPTGKGYCNLSWTQTKTLNRNSGTTTNLEGMYNETSITYKTPIYSSKCNLLTTQDYLVPNSTPLKYGSPAPHSNPKSPPPLYNIDLSSHRKYNVIISSFEYTGDDGVEGFVPYFWYGGVRWGGWDACSCGVPAATGQTAYWACQCAFECGEG